MTTLLLTHLDCLNHEPGAYHPENPGRLASVLRHLEGPVFERLVRRDAPLAGHEHLERIHPRAHVEAVLKAVPDNGIRHLDGDTALSPGSGDAALRAAGAVVAAVDAVFNENIHNAFCAVRPPGHHAEPDRAMGFCLFNNIGIAARHAQAIHGARRIGIVDFDVHHGNGTQTLAETDNSLFYASTHQSPHYPGTGAASERGQGNIVNIPLRAGSDGMIFKAAYDSYILPALEAFEPELILISAGFDGHEADPLADFRLREDDFAWVTERLAEIARRHCADRIVSVLEGGYDLEALGRSAAAHVAMLMIAGDHRQ